MECREKSICVAQIANNRTAKHSKRFSNIKSSMQINTPGLLLHSFKRAQAIATIEQDRVDWMIPLKPSFQWNKTRMPFLKNPNTIAFVIYWNHLLNKSNFGCCCNQNLNHKQRVYTATSKAMCINMLTLYAAINEHEPVSYWKKITTKLDECVQFVSTQLDLPIKKN